MSEDFNPTLVEMNELSKQINARIEKEEQEKAIKEAEKNLADLKAEAKVSEPAPKKVVKKATTKMFE